MSNSYKLSVALADVTPGNNPRKDFGDIDALAATIEVTGGQPVNPLIVVRDGNRYRLVDGERRYRALKKLHGPNGTADALCFASMDEAQEAVAMLATDDKMQLSEAEQARGFQQMMILGVESRTIAKAMRRKTSEIAAARAVAKQAPAQATLDQMIAAAEFDDENDRMAVLSADPDKYEAKAKAIKNERKAEYEAKELYDCILGLGFDPCDEQPEGYRGLMWASTAKEMERLVDKYDEHELAVWPVPWNRQYWYLGCKDKSEAKETPEQRAERERKDRIKVAYVKLNDALMKEVATCDIFPEMQEVAGRLRGESGGYTRESLKTSLKELGVTKRIIDEHLFGPASMWETLTEMSSGRLGWAKWTVTWLPPAIDEGSYWATDEDRWLLEQAEAEVAKEDGK